MKKLLKQALKFIGLSGIGWIVDFSIYTILGFLSSNLFINNMVSSWIGVTFVFIFSTRTVFKNNSKISLRWKYVIYIVYQCGLILLISKLLDNVNVFILSHFTIELIQHFSGIISKVLVTPITMCMNFFVMKGIMEKI